MKILCVSDTVMPPLENAANLRRRFSDVDLVLSCGDMPATYLEYITTILGLPLFYVRGNHDESYEQSPPGGVDLHNQLVTYRGVSFFGIEGSVRYNQGKIQYTQHKMSWMILSQAPRMLWRRWRRGRAVDVFVAHSPARHIHDAEDLPHQGFHAFHRFLRWYRPRFMLHGHVHTWDRRKTVRTRYEDTQIININPYMVIDVS